jgi:hypothetical protein
MSYSEDYLKLKDYIYTPVRVYIAKPYMVFIYLGRETPDEIRKILTDVSAEKIIKNYRKLASFYGDYWFQTLSLDDLFDVDNFNKLKDTSNPRKVNLQSTITFYNRMESSTISDDIRKRIQLTQESDLKKTFLKPIEKPKDSQKGQVSEFQVLEAEPEEIIEGDALIVRYVFDNIFIDDSVGDVKKKIYLTTNILPEFQHIVYEKRKDFNFESMTHTWIRTSGRPYSVDIFKILREKKLENVIDQDFYNKVKNNELFLEDYSNNILADISNFNYDLWVFDFQEIMKNFTQKDIENFTSSKIDANLLFYSVAKKYYPLMKQENFNNVLQGNRPSPPNKTLLGRDFADQYNMMKFIQDIDYKSVKVSVKDMKVIQIFIHVNYHLYYEPFLQLRGIFDYFETNENIPFIKYRDPMTDLTIKKVNKNILQYIPQSVLEDQWIKGEHPQGIHFRIRQSLNPRNPDYNRFAIVNLVEDGKIALKCYWKATNNASFMNVLDCIESLNQLIERVNGIQYELTQKNRIIKSVDILKRGRDYFQLSENTEIAFFNVQFKYKPKVDDLLDYNLMDHTLATFYPFVNVVTNKESKSYQGTYLRYKRVSDYDLAIEKYIKNLKENYDFDDTKIIIALINIFSKTKEEARKAVEEYNRRNNLPAPQLESDDVLYDIELIKKIRAATKQPGVDIEIQDSEEDNVIKIEGVKSINSFSFILNFLYRAIHVFENLKGYLKYESPFKTRYNEIARNYSKVKMAKRRVVKESSNVKTLKEVDPELFDIDPSINPKKYKLYSKLCQGDRKQPISVSEDEAKSLKRTNKVEYILDYPSKTQPDKVNHFVCMDKDYRYPGFIQGDKHPKGYCLPCCYTSSSTDDAKSLKLITYKKCLGEEIEEVEDTLTNLRYIKQSNKELKPLGLGKLPLLLDVYLNEGKTLNENKNNIVESGTDYYLRYGVPQNKHVILNIISHLVNDSFDSKKILKEMISFLKENKKIFQSLEGGRLLKDFGNLQAFIDYLESDETIALDNIWNLLNYPGVFKKFPKGLNVFCLMQDQEDKINLICPDNDKLDQFYQESRPTLIIYNTVFNYYPIYNILINKSKMSYVKTFDTNDSIVKRIHELYKERCFDTRLKGEETFKKITGFDIPLSSFIIEEVLRPMKPVLQYTNAENKVMGLIYSNKKGEKFYVPTKLSRPLEGVPITTEQLIFNMNVIIRNLDEIAKKKNIPVKVIKYIINESGNVTTLITQTGARIFVKEVSLKSVDVKLPVERVRYSEKEVDKFIVSKEQKIDKRLEQVKKLEYLNELYQLYRYEISKFLNREVDSDIREKILKILRKKEGVRTALKGMKELTDTEKAEIVRLHQQEDDIKYIERLLLDLKFSVDQQTKKKLYEIASLENKTDNEKQKMISEIVGKITDKIVHEAKGYPDLEKFAISNIRQLCGANINKKSCDQNINCYFSKSGDCKLFIPKDQIKAFVENITYELIRNPYKRLELLEDQMRYIINKNEFSKSENEIVTTGEKIEFS